VNTEWPRKRISEIANHSLGKMLDKAKNKGELHPYLRNLNVRWFDFDLSDLTEMRFLPGEGSRYTVAKGDLVICEGGYPGRAAIWNDDHPIHFQKALHRVRFLEPHHAKWCLYYLQAQDLSGTLKEHFNGAGIQHFTGEALAKFELPIAPLSEQQRIVAILDEAFEGIATAKANAEKNLRNARGLFDSELFELLKKDGSTWPQKTLRQVAIDFGRGKSKHRPRNDPKLYGGTYPFIQTGDVRNSEHLITEYTQSYSEAGLAQSKLWPKGTLCITIAANIAETGILDFEACFPDSVIGVVVDPAQTTGKYVEYMLQTVKAELKAKGKGSAQDNINLATFENERFPFPDLRIQADLVRQLDELSVHVQRLEDIYLSKLSALEELKKSLLHQAFNGKL
jgi:type I restriction enzyme S subunit